jgi:hypothetical protein
MDTGCKLRKHYHLAAYRLLETKYLGETHQGTAGRIIWWFLAKMANGDLRFYRVTLMEGPERWPQSRPRKMIEVRHKDSWQGCIPAQLNEDELTPAPEKGTPAKLFPKLIPEKDIPRVAAARILYWR